MVPPGCFASQNPSEATQVSMCPVRKDGLATDNPGQQAMNHGARKMDGGSGVLAALECRWHCAVGVEVRLGDSFTGYHWPFSATG
eukprot:s1247_g17.t1